MDKRQSKRIIEAALFTSPGDVPLRELAKITDSNIAETRVIVNELIHDYEAKDTSLEIRSESEGVRMGVKPEYEGHVGHMAASPELHKGIMKTLAYIAYKQPVKQAEVINFRNSKAYEHIKILREKGFIKKDKKGITFIIATTPKFREYFGKDAGKKELIPKQELTESLEESDSQESGSTETDSDREN
ncbi:MAG TPA: SMC-Scp complex subunit ScpB [archaeon]|nr:SMC-Scp complex subunit ScpB [archaeon]